MITRNIETNHLAGRMLGKTLLIMSVVIIILSVGCIPKTPNVASNTISTSNPTSTIPSQQAAFPGNPEAQDNGQEITPQELADRLKESNPLVLVDLRDPEESQISSIPGTTHNIPFMELEQRLGELDKDAEIVLYCRVGLRSALARDYMMHAGFKNVRNLKGGFNAWKSEVGGIE